ncbi:interferon-induced GTP-binding protein Mx1 [Colletotrichum orchidophilum]|uniref:Interferon-induced GTP-binding protein Mx1 n=1 Tax=Colletotrichum orchidophilum TaxID=1209926 RepID=A0A1G4AZY7_9PEZI|nr:interferon-induced GTP-binding protein Mx1 [Colletotrichum orchidophilum]OHE94729.1 interferon-induced GTP-binding protein Mx1 [Colletotrichum orchidophilum]
MRGNNNDGDTANESLGDDVFSQTIDKLRELGIADLPGLQGGRKERLKKFMYSVEKDDLALADVFAQANEAMGLRGVGGGDDCKLSTFAEDVLKIEISGPDQHHLTVIDVPGIFRTATKGLTTDNDIVLVRNMVNRYIKDQRTIILSVIPCNVDVATQEVLTLAKQVDPEGLRTMSVLTKPDLATERATQQIVCELVEGKRHSLRLGYCVVKNRSADDDFSTMTDRNSSEKSFFSASPWARLRSSNRVGVNSLAVRLRDLLRDISNKEFKNVKAEIYSMLNQNEAEFKRMGPSRARPDAQRRYLGQIASDFQEADLRARDGHYSGMDIFDQNPKLRLITSIVNHNEQFNKVFVLRGHTRKFEGPAETEFGPNTPLNVDTITNPDEALGGILVFYESRNAELGSFPGSMLAQVFKEQTKKWEPLVLKHVSQAIMIVHEFIGAALRLKCTDANTFDELHDHFLLPKLRASYQRALEHAQFLINVELSGQPYTMNHYFNINPQKSRAIRLKEAINKAIGPAAIRNDHGHTLCLSSPSSKSGLVIGNTASRGAEVQAAENNGNPFEFTTLKGTESLRAAGWWVSKSMLPKLTTGRSNVEQVREDIHDTLHSYYKIARERFVDVVLQQAVFHFLLDAKTGPLKIFTPDLVMGLDNKQLQMIAGEDVATRNRRDILTRDTENLKLAMEELRMSK